VSKGIVPDYAAWVRPEEEMWLGRIAKKLARHEYAARGEFVADFRQLLRNARAYNAPGRGTWGMPGARPRPAPPACRLSARRLRAAPRPPQRRLRRPRPGLGRAAGVTRRRARAELVRVAEEVVAAVEADVAAAAGELDDLERRVAEEAALPPAPAGAWRAPGAGVPCLCRLAACEAVFALRACARCLAGRAACL
jgi:hypothetical protein